MPADAALIGVLMIDLNITFNKKLLKEILFKLDKLETKMATLADIKQELTGITDAVAAQHASFDLLVTEVRQLLANKDIAGADALLAEIQADKEAIIAAVDANTALAAEVDAVNGDPVPAPAPVEVTVDSTEPSA